MGEHHIINSSLDIAALDKVFYHVFACPDVALLVKSLTAEMAEAEAAAPSPDGIANITGVSGVQALKSPLPTVRLFRYSPGRLFF